MATEAFRKALTLIDAANAQDPNQELDTDGVAHPKELLYSQRMSRILADFAPDASEELQLAVRAQHLQRWRIPRDDFSRDRGGYLQWRRKLGQFHAQRCGELMTKAGYSASSVARAGDLLQKKNLKQDSDAQSLEDVACLVFIQFYLSEFATQHDEDKLIAIIQKTWRKMSPQAQKTALSLPLSNNTLELISKALKTT